MLRPFWCGGKQNWQVQRQRPTRVNSTWTDGTDGENQRGAPWSSDRRPGQRGRERARRRSEATRQSGASTQMAVFPAAEWATDDRTASGVAPGRINRRVGAGDGVKLAAARLFIGERRRER
uniref:Uncharacterized protein n=1 Tax=Plectus sambesii TaxID=2011161 RepID=A0A914VDF4_9BILA